MTTYYLINPENEIINSVLADTPELALLGTPSGTVAVTELGPEHHYPVLPSVNGPADPITKLAFLRRFTAEERIAIRASLDPVIVDFLSLLDLAQEVVTTDPDTQAGIEYLVAQGLLTLERAELILQA